MNLWQQGFFTVFIASLSAIASGETIKDGKTYCAWLQSADNCVAQILTEISSCSLSTLSAEVGRFSQTLDSCTYDDDSKITFASSIDRSKRLPMALDFKVYDSIGDQCYELKSSDILNYKITAPNGSLDISNSETDSGDDISLNMTCQDGRAYAVTGHARSEAERLCPDIAFYGGPYLHYSQILSPKSRTITLGISMTNGTAPDHVLFSCSH